MTVTLEAVSRSMPPNACLAFPLRHMNVAVAPLESAFQSESRILPHFCLAAAVLHVTGESIPPVPVMPEPKNFHRDSPGCHRRRSFSRPGIGACFDLGFCHLWGVLGVLITSGQDLTAVSVVWSLSGLCFGSPMLLEFFV